MENVSIEQFFQEVTVFTSCSKFADLKTSLLVELEESKLFNLGPSLKFLITMER